jgi:transposase-like protein
MSKNSVQFQQGYSVFECIADYGTETLCEHALFQWRWPTGFECPACGHTKYCQLKTRKLYQCNHCHQQVSLTSNTLFDNTKLPLVTWFMAIHLLTQSKTSMSAMALKRQLGISYNTAWSVRHKLLQAMKEYEDKRPIQGIIQLDDVYWGGEHRGGKRGRGSENKTPFVAAVALNKEGHPIQMKMNVVEGFKTDAING